MRFEHENNYANKGVAGAGLGLGIAGTALGLLAGGLNGIGGFGGNCAPENTPVNRYEAAKDSRIAELETEIKLRDANTFTMSEMGKLREYVDRRFERVEHELCDQKVYNATISNQVAQLMNLTKIVVPNASICPGWGDVTVSVTPTSTPTTTG